MQGFEGVDNKLNLKINGNIMSKEIDILNRIITMQEINYGNATDTHVDLIGLCKEAKEIVRNSIKQKKIKTNSL